MTSRPYTGTTDAVHEKPREGTKAFVEYCKFLFGVKSLGIFANRNINGSGMPNPPKLNLKSPLVKVKSPLIINA